MGRMPVSQTLWAFSSTLYEADHVCPSRPISGAFSFYGEFARSAVIRRKKWGMHNRGFTIQSASSRTLTQLAISLSAKSNSWLLRAEWCRSVLTQPQGAVFSWQCTQVSQCCHTGLREGGAKAFSQPCFGAKHTCKIYSLQLTTRRIYESKQLSEYLPLWHTANSTFVLPFFAR